VVVTVLLLLHDVIAVFICYHVLICLVLPLVRNGLVLKRPVKAHFRDLGLIGAGTARGVVIGLILGSVLAGGTLVLFRLQGDALLAENNVAGILSQWGVTPSRLWLLQGFMLLVNGPAEELFWRGFIHHELAGVRPRQLALGVASLCYASYHAATLMLLLGSALVAALLFVAVLAGGLIWAWLRERTGSVWPGLLSHWMATVAYMLVARPLLW